MRRRQTSCPPVRPLKRAAAASVLLPILLLVLLGTACRREAAVPETRPAATATAVTASTAAVTPASAAVPPAASRAASDLVTPVSTELVSATVQSEEGQRAWREDLHFLADRALARHPDFTYRITPEAFTQAVAEIDAAIPFLSDNQIIVELIRLLAMSDGHTRLQPHGGKAGFRLYDLQLYQFGDDFYVVDAADGVQEAIGARLVGIGTQEVGEVIRQLEPLVAHENEMFVRLYLPLFAVTPEVLEALGIVQDMARPGFLLEDEGGARFTINPPIVEPEDTLNLAESFGQLLLPQQAEPLYLSRHREENFWYTLLDGGNTLYIQYNLVQPMTQSGLNMSMFAGELEEAMKSGEPVRAILDLRHNMGGELGNQEPLLAWAQRFAAEHPGQLYVLIGRQTFSAGSYLVTQLEQTTDAVFAGEPTGSHPNFYANARIILLPNSLITGSVSTRYFEPSDPDDSRPWKDPDILAPPAAEAYFSGRDPALEALP